MALRRKCSSSPVGPHFSERNWFSLSCRRWPPSFLTLICQDRAVAGHRRTYIPATWCGSSPENRGTPKFQAARTSGGGLGRLDLQNLAGARDRDRPGLHCLRDLTHKVDVQEPVLQPCALDQNMVGKLDATLEGPLGNALVEHVAGLLLVVGLFLAADRQRVFLPFDRKIGVGEPGDCDRDAKGVLAAPLNIIGRIAGHRAFHAAELVEHGEHPVEADSRTVEGSEIECTHSMTSLV